MWEINRAWNSNHHLLSKSTPKVNLVCYFTLILPPFIIIVLIVRACYQAGTEPVFDINGIILSSIPHSFPLSMHLPAVCAICSTAGKKSSYVEFT